jgi:hypothetical protein
MNKQEQIGKDRANYSKPIMKPRNIKISTYALLSSCLLLSLLSCSPIKPSTEVSPPIKTEDIPAIKHENLPVYGAPFIPETEQNGWIYYSRTVQRDNSTDALQKGFQHLCKMKYAGNGEEVVLSREVNPETIVVSEDWLYFRDLRWLKDPTGPLKRIRNDGTGLTSLTTEDVDFFCIEEEWIYYTYSYDFNYTLLRMKKDGSEKSVLMEKQLDDRIEAMFFLGDWTYIATSHWPYGDDPFDNKPLYRINFNADAPSPVLLIEHAKEVQIRGNWIYYRSGENNLTLFRTSMDGKTTEQLSDDRIQQFLLTRPGYLYYLALDQKAKLWNEPVVALVRIQVDTKDKELIPSIPLHDSPYLGYEIRNGILFETFQSYKPLFYHISLELEIKKITFESWPSILTHDWVYFMATDPETGLDKNLQAKKLDDFLRSNE